MIPNKFNIVDFSGFDLAAQSGEAIPGIYDRIVGSHWNCVYIMCFGLKFAGFNIAPQYMTPEITEDVIKLSGYISIDRDDVITVNLPPPELAIIPGIFEENGTFTPPSGFDGFAPVTVNVSGGVNRKTKSEWDALSFMEKKALGFTAVGETTDITGEWYDLSAISFIADFISVTGDGSTDTKTISVDNYSDYNKLAVFVAVNDNNTGVIEIDGVSQTVTKSGDVYFCATIIDSKQSIITTIGHGDGGSAMYSVAVYGIVGSLASFANHAAYVSGTSSTIDISTVHSAAIVDIMTDRVSGTCTFDGTNMDLTLIGRGYFGNLYHAYLIVYGLSAGTKELSGPSGVKCFQVLALD